MDKVETFTVGGRTYYAISIPNASTERLIDYWTKGKGAAEIGWRTDGAMKRCIAKLRGKVREPGGLCAELHKKVTGEWPAEKGVES